LKRGEEIQGSCSTFKRRAIEKTMMAQAVKTAVVGTHKKRGKEKAGKLNMGKKTLIEIWGAEDPTSPEMRQKKVIDAPLLGN